MFLYFISLSHRPPCPTTPASVAVMHRKLLFCFLCVCGFCWCYRVCVTLPSPSSLTHTHTQPHTHTHTAPVYSFTRGVLDQQVQRIAGDTKVGLFLEPSRPRRGLQPHRQRYLETERETEMWASDLLSSPTLSSGPRRIQ